MRMITPLTFRNMVSGNCSKSNTIVCKTDHLDLKTTGKYSDIRTSTITDYTVTTDTQEAFGSVTVNSDGTISKLPSVTLVLNGLIECTVSNLTCEADLILAYYTSEGQLCDLVQLPAVNGSYTFGQHMYALTVSAFLLDKNGTPLAEKGSILCN